MGDAQGQAENEVVSAYGQPGLDYSLDRHATRNTMYPAAAAHHMMQHPSAMPSTGKFFSALIKIPRSHKIYIKGTKVSREKL